MNDSIVHVLKNSIQTAVKISFDIEVAPDTIRLEHPSEEEKGDYASNIAMVLAGKLKRKPMDIAHTIVEAIQKTVETQGLASLQSVEVATPGFINFRLKPAYLVEVAKDAARLTGGAITDGWAAKKVMVEFAHPNPLKEFHIGHLRNIALGESLVRLLEASGATVFRANYESDIGMHTAKALWGIYKKMDNVPMDNETMIQAMRELTKQMTSAEKAEFLGQGYALGSKAYEDDEVAKNEIIELNKRIYKYPQSAPLWKETRQMSLDYFDTIYKRLGSHFDRLFFESETEKRGKELVIEGVEKGIFVKDADRSIYFPGKKIGLNNCVFVTRENYATYEGKEVALEDMEYQAFPFDLDIHVVANEQINFFQIAFAAVEQMFPYQKGRQHHLAYGMVKLKSGKMSSRTGEVITADELIDMAKEKMRLITQSTNEKEETVEKIAVAAVKYTMLRVNPKQDIIFDVADSVSMEGDSGPYLLYTYARCRSVLRKSKAQLKSEKNDNLQLNEEELSLLRLIYQFPEVVGEAAKKMSPNLVSQYLFDLAQRFNAFYNKHHIVHQESNERTAHSAQLTMSFRVFLTETTAAILKRGLFLLGIETVERM